MWHESDVANSRRKHKHMHSHLSCTNSGQQFQRTSRRKQRLWHFVTESGVMQLLRVNPSHIKKITCSSSNYKIRWTLAYKIRWTLNQWHNQNTHPVLFWCAFEYLMTLPAVSPAWVLKYSSQSSKSSYYRAITNEFQHFSHGKGAEQRKNF